MSKVVELHVLKQYNLLHEMGSGAYGHVWQVQERKSGAKYALKKVFDAFRNSIDAQRTYRQVNILHQLHHDNIIQLHRVIKAKNKKDLYLIFQFMQADLHSIVGSNILQKKHQIYIFYQILKALKYLHSAQLIHRDLKPSNVLLNSQCTTKLCDFGLIRSLNIEESQEIILSQQVATKWYRAPELLLGSRKYHKAVDMWSFGCIVVEILTGKPMFAGGSTLNQLQKIIEYTGKISQQDLDVHNSPIADQLILQIKVKPKCFKEYFSNVDVDFYELIRGLLHFNPQKRLNVNDALNLDLFNDFREEIKSLRTSNFPIVPILDDNIRLKLDVYRRNIYAQIVQKYGSQRILKRYRQNFSSKDKFHLKTKTTSQYRSLSNNSNKKLRVSSGSNNSLLKKINKDKIVYRSQSMGQKKSINSINKRHSPYESKILANMSNTSNNHEKKNINVQKFNKYIVKPINSGSEGTSKILKKSKNRLQPSDKRDILKSFGIENQKSFKKYLK